MPPRVTSNTAAQTIGRKPRRRVPRGLLASAHNTKLEPPPLTLGRVPPKVGAQ